MSTQFSTRSTSFLVDGSALFFAIREVSPEKPMNYGVLWNIARLRAGDGVEFRPAHFYTASDPGNAKQVSFHKAITYVGWKLVETLPHEAGVVNPLLSGEQNFRLIRFDARIAYAIGRITRDNSKAHIIIVSDSFPLAAPIADVVAREASVSLAFFASHLDPRWHKFIREHEKAKHFSFIDLGAHGAELFSRPKSSGKEGLEHILDLP